MTNLSFLDDLAEMGARTARAPRALILKRENATNTVTVVGRFGTLFEPSPAYPIPAFIYPDAAFISIPDIRADDRLIGHPILDYLPRINSLIFAKISPDLNNVPRFTFTLCICNSAPETFVSGEALSAITHVVNVCRQFVSAISNADAYLAESSSPPPSAYLHPPDLVRRTLQVEKDERAIAASYLIDTLPHKHVLHENDVGSFISLRTWRKSIKSKQLEALSQAMLDPTDEFLSAVASEMANSAQKMFGAISIQSVVPLPTVEASNGAKLAALVAPRVADKLGVQHANALEYKAAGGSENAKKINGGHFPAMSFSPVTEGGVLLLDDFAASIPQICAAQNLVRKTGASCFAMSWLGPA